MRVALVSQEYPPETGHGGIATQTYAKAHGLTALGHDVFVLSHSWDADRHEYDTDGVHVIRIPSWDERMRLFTPAARWVTYSGLVAEEISRLVAKGPIDLLDFPEYGGEGYVHLLNDSEWNHVPSVIQLHAPLVMFSNTIGWPEKNSELFRVGTHMEATTLRLADAVYSSSQCSAQWCVEHYGLDGEAVDVLHMGIDIDVWKPSGSPKEPNPTIAFVGKIALNKGVDTLLDAALRVAKRHPTLRLWMFGPGDDELAKDLMHRAQASGFPDLVEIFGYVEPEELSRRLPRAHVFAAPSFYEGGPGFVNLEAMACALPIVASDGSGVSEIVRDGDTGILVPPRDTDSLWAALEKLLSNPEQASEMGARGRLYVEEEADTRSCVKKLEQLYERIILDAARTDSSSKPFKAE